MNVASLASIPTFTFVFSLLAFMVCILLYIKATFHNNVFYFGVAMASVFCITFISLFILAVCKWKQIIGNESALSLGTKKAL